MIKKIKINKLEEIGLGKSINGEIVVDHNETRVSTITDKHKNYYSLSNNTLTQVNSVEISNTIYNMYLNSINKIN